MKDVEMNKMDFVTVPMMSVDDIVEITGIAPDLSNSILKAMKLSLWSAAKSLHFIRKRVLLKCIVIHESNENLHKKFAIGVLRMAMPVGI